jgi:hypothetical protein
MGYQAAVGGDVIADIFFQNPVLFFQVKHKVFYESVIEQGFPAGKMDGEPLVDAGIEKINDAPSQTLGHPMIFFCLVAIAAVEIAAFTDQQDQMLIGQLF